MRIFHGPDSWNPKVFNYETFFNVLYIIDHFMHQDRIDMPCNMQRFIYQCKLLLSITWARKIFGVIATDLKHSHRAWITIDNQLYLWDYLNPEQCEVFDGLNEIILSVSLSAPKPGIFLDTIKYVIAIGEVNSQFAMIIFCYYDYFSSSHILRAWCFTS